MNMQITFSPSNPLVRAIYCVSLLFAAFSIVRGVGVFNFNVGGAMPMLVMALAPKIALFLLIVFRFIGVVIGKFKLNVVATSGPIYVLRVIAIFLMSISCLIALFAIFGTLTSSRSDGAGYALMSGILGGGSPIGLLLFEASRILERELLVESKNT